MNGKPIVLSEVGSSNNQNISPNNLNRITTPKAKKAIEIDSRKSLIKRPAKELSDTTSTPKIPEINTERPRRAIKVPHKFEDFILGSFIVSVYSQIILRFYFRLFHIWLVKKKRKMFYYDVVDIGEMTVDACGTKNVNDRVE